jgi:hypothetical protein
MYPQNYAEILKMFPHETENKIKQTAKDLASISLIGLGT